MGTLHAEISIVPVGSNTSMSKEIAAAFDAISKINGIRAMITPLGTQVESESLKNILEAINAAHQAAKSAGARRVISTIRIDERLDKTQSLENKVQSVKEKLKK